MGQQFFLNRTVRYKKNEISYSLIRKPVVNINIRVHADRSVMVSASPRVPVWVLDDYVLKKAEWILKCFEKYQARDVPNRMEYADGEKIRILGREYQLHLVQAAKERVCVEDDKIYLLLKNIADPIKKKRIYEKWYAEQCSKMLRSIVDSCLPLFVNYRIPNPELKIRKMKTRWGSCSPAHKAITLNQLIFAAPRQCVEYVVVHELAHFVQANHSKAFYTVVRSVMPDYKERKKLLESSR
ncbi:MAG: SprT family zinc-dependent metalloprotease [Eubacteriales bacterium]